MRKFIWILTLTLTLVACGTRKGHFKIEGKFLHLNQGELYIYDADGGSHALDTIKVANGSFVYETACSEPTTLMLVFPNFSEQPVFAESGKSVSFKADASHLKEMEISGTRDNELMTKFRKLVSTASPPEITKQAVAMIEEYPESPIGTYLVRKYFLQTASPSYKEAERLVDIMLTKQPKNRVLNKTKEQIARLKNTEKGNPLPNFTAYDINGKLISTTTLTTAPVAVISVWASWNYESLSMQRDLKELRKKSKQRLQVMSISLDASRYACREAMKKDSISWPTICDGEMVDGKTFKKLGFGTIPDNIVLVNGRIKTRGLKPKELRDEVEKLL